MNERKLWQTATMLLIYTLHKIVLIPLLLTELLTRLTMNLLLLSLVSTNITHCEHLDSIIYHPTCLLRDWISSDSSTCEASAKFQCSFPSTVFSTFIIVLFFATTKFASDHVEHKDRHCSLCNALLCIDVYQKGAIRNQTGVLFWPLDKLRQID